MKVRSPEIVETTLWNAIKIPPEADNVAGDEVSVIIVSVILLGTILGATAEEAEHENTQVMVGSWYMKVPWMISANQYKTTMLIVTLDLGILTLDIITKTVMVTVEVIITTQEITTTNAVVVTGIEAEVTMAEDQILVALSEAVEEAVVEDPSGIRITTADASAVARQSILSGIVLITLRIKDSPHQRRVISIFR